MYGSQAEGCAQDANYKLKTLKIKHVAKGIRWSAETFIG